MTGRRFRVNEKCSWPERIGCTGHVVDPPLTPGVYPWDKRIPNTVVWIDQDPLRDESDNVFTRPPDGWSCVIRVEALDFEDSQENP